MKKKLQVIVASLVLVSNFNPAFSISTTQSSIQRNEDVEIINLLPEQYRQLVANNLSIAGENKSNLLSAIKSSNKNHLEGLGYLLAYMPQRDLKSLSTEFLLENLNLAYQVKEQAPWSKNIPTHIFLNNVLPYANVTETRDNWRKEFYDKFYNIAVSEGNIEKAVMKLNQYAFDTYNVHYHAYLREKPDQSPYESIKIGYASCTGLSIFITDALRAVGIPARLAGIASWPLKGGNHTWVEVWDNGWHYFGASEAGEYDHTWFTDLAREADVNNRMTSIYAVSYEHTNTLFPMVWDGYNTEVYAENVTIRYRNISE